MSDEEGWRRNRRVTEVLDEAEVVHVAVAARNGPHVTPAVFDVDGGRLWFVTPRRSVKARVISHHRRVGALVQLGRWSVVIGGRARIVDPLTARGVFSPGRLLDLPFAAVGYLGRNHRHATGTIRDHEAPTLALSRVLVSIDIRRLALLDGWDVAANWGRWSATDLLLRGEPPPGHAPDLAAVPPGVRNLLADDSPVVLGWQSLFGPLALPARWRGDAGGLETSGAAMVLTGAASGSPACVTAERSRYRLKSKQGLLLTGDGHARLAGDGPLARVTLDARRTVWWRGEETHAIAASSA
ncbi:MAG: pyridoxamine 5'-phosphate oxidase family protein [Actinobacteria bacterium]|nr:pyridoxamine 5'-phosphate oxidase family protein [Actinomycetota bacterium]